jgi:hypothetical protein
MLYRATPGTYVSTSCWRSREMREYQNDELLSFFGSARSAGDSASHRSCTILTYSAVVVAGMGAMA